MLKIYDREAQALFDNNFNILNGPDAPDLNIRELDKELIFTLSNSGSSNNIDESYSEKDPYITKPYNLANSPNYEFQGYLVYQLRDETVSVTDLSDPDKARLIYRTDIKDDVKGIVNHYLDPILGVYTPIEEVASTLSEGVIGSVDNGVEYSFQITDDILEATSDQSILGKSSDSDTKNNKSTYIKVIGIEEAKKKSNKLSASAIESLEELKLKETNILIELAKYISYREK